MCVRTRECVCVVKVIELLHLRQQPFVTDSLLCGAQCMCVCSCFCEDVVLVVNVLNCCGTLNLFDRSK